MDRGPAKKRNEHRKDVKMAARSKAVAPEVKLRASKSVLFSPPVYDVSTIELFGYTDMIQEQFSVKMQTAITDKHEGKNVGPKQIRKPEEEYEALKYKLPDGREAMKAAAFEQAAIWTAYTLGIKAKEVKSSMRVLDGLIPILGWEEKGGKVIRTAAAKVRMVRDYGKDARGGARIMFRPYYSNWRAIVRIQHRPEVLSLQQIVDLLNHAGFSSGVGAHRPSSPKKSGPHGMFSASMEQAVKMAKQLEVVAS
jgi:hypothetical protein